MLFVTVYPSVHIKDATRQLIRRLCLFQLRYEVDAVGPEGVHSQLHSW
jgi:hypothetical protein